MLDNPQIWLGFAFKTHVFKLSYDTNPNFSTRLKTSTE